MHSALEIEKKISMYCFLDYTGIVIGPLTIGQIQ